MEVLVAAALAALIYFWIKAARNQTNEVEARFAAVAKENGLNIFHQCKLVEGVVGLSESPPAICWVSQRDKSDYKILRADDVRSISHDVQPFHNRTTHTIEFTTNSVRDPSMKIKFAMWKDGAEDFYKRSCILFDLR